VAAVPVALDQTIPDQVMEMQALPILVAGEAEVRTMAEYRLLLVVQVVQA